MPKEKEYLCPYCKEKVPASESKKVGNRYYHEECYEKKLKEEDGEQLQAREYKELIDYICNLYKIKAPTMLILSQIKNFKNELGMRYKGMELSLKYFHGTLGNPTREDGIGIVPYVYDEARRHHQKILNVQKSIEEDEEYIKEKTVHIKRPDKSNKQEKMIDISLL